MVLSATTEAFVAETALKALILEFHYDKECGFVISSRGF